MSDASLPHALTLQTFLAIAGPVPSNRRNSQEVNASILRLALPSLMDTYEIDRPLRVAHFLAQLAHESDSFSTFEEYASGAAYEGRDDLGNTRPGDGKRFKGRGPIQLTGRANYRAFTGWLRRQLPGSTPDFEEKPEQVLDDQWVPWSAVYFWVDKNLNRYADRDDVLAITRIINGGRNGLDDRKAKLARAKAAIAALQASQARTPDRGLFPVLHRGLMNDGNVERLQFFLRKQGAEVAVDGDFGPATELAVKAFQARRGIIPTGIVSPDTWSSLAGE
ncbi:putative chitinase [Rhizobium sp. RU35A]|uniref:peptidoglycan-binding protein n=1 Tax=Rhizobium sp. RU35A TaxID=1907414 RepID=UPI000956FA34|nr:peptidoglycan-binding protein [Rhizobium sp. RU35A]SIR41265.1 putative chitinase [Rhizobium sp. RU35A]